MSWNGSVHNTFQFEIEDGKSEEFASLADAAIGATEGSEPGMTTYRWDVNGTNVLIPEGYSDEAAMMVHLGGPVASDIFPKLLAIAIVDGFDVHGDLGSWAHTGVEGSVATASGSRMGFNR